MPLSSVPNLGIGIGLRPIHYEDLFEIKPKIDWLEIISENFMGDSPQINQLLEKILEHYPVVMHGVCLAIGSPDSLNFDYLKKLKALARKTKSPWVSDHLCWGHLDGTHYHDLLPLPQTKEVANYVAERARVVQDYLEVPLALENLSSYLTFHENEMNEWEFYTAVVEKAGISMMLDVNNIYVSSRNQGFDTQNYLDAIPMDRVVQVHIAGHKDYGTHCLDTHNQKVIADVWELYAQVYAKTKGISTLLEWDDDFVSLVETCEEAFKARQFQETFQLAQAL
ncbi:MAG: DUF692 domain-containing protein [Parachlamydiales bacterium]|nr:DUF692 domain-containing protein [Parachlamydiales bacterium]